MVRLLHCPELTSPLGSRPYGSGLVSPPLFSPNCKGPPNCDIMNKKFPGGSLRNEERQRETEKGPAL